MNPPPARSATLPKPPPGLLRPLPQRRVDRFTWQWIDSAWIALAVAGCVVVGPHGLSARREAVGVAIDALCAAAAYVAGLKIHSRLAGITAAVLLATSRNFGDLCALHPTSGAAACAVVTAVAAYGVGWLIPTYCAACLAFALGFNGALIGLVIASVPLVQRREHATAGLSAYAAFGVLWTLVYHPFRFPDALRPWATWRDAHPLLGMALLALLFLMPFVAEATLKGSRERWLMSLSLVVTLVVIVFTSTSPIAPQLYVAFPLATLVIGVGLARLMPLIAGEYPAPALRYAAAALAVAATLLLKLYADPHVAAAKAAFARGSHAADARTLARRPER